MPLVGLKADLRAFERIRVQNPSMEQEPIAIQTIRSHHPLVIEGMGGYDNRDPSWVTEVILEQLKARWAIDPPKKPLLLVTQGDPFEEKGISAITRLVADRLAIQRALIFLDPSIADYHALNADRYKVICELPYSALTHLLQTELPDVLTQITDCVDTHLCRKNRRRRREGKKALLDYFRDFALLQEVTKIGCKQICGTVTVAHTSANLDVYSVSSFYRVSLELGLIDVADMVPFPKAY